MVRAAARPVRRPVLWLIAAGLVLLALALALPGGPARAQDTVAAAEREVQGPQPGPAYSSWERVARRAEIALEEGRASNAALEGLRSELADWRADFQAAQASNATRIETLRAQIAALGAVPDSGTEAPEIARRREELNAQLARLEAPRRTADEAYSRADNLIREIDGLIRERQAALLLQLGPSPLVPGRWGPAVRDVASLLRATAAETVAAWQNPGLMADAREKAPYLALLLVVAALSLLRGRRWTLRLTEAVGRGLSPPARMAARMVLSLGQVVLPVAGLLALTEALINANLLGLRGQVLAERLPVVGLAWFGALWLGSQIFPRGETGNTVLGLSPERRAEGRLLSGLLGLLVGVLGVIATAAEFEGWRDATLAVTGFPVLVTAGLALVRIGALIGHRQPDEGASQAALFRRRLAIFVGRLAVAIGIAGPVLAAIGYQSAASFLTVPAAASLALIAGLVLLQQLGTQGYAILTRASEDEAREALVPVLLGLALALASVPVFALIWGARVADLTEILARLREGFTMGGTRVSPGQFLTLVLVFLIGFALTRLLQGTLRSTVLPKTRIDPGGQTAIVSGLGYLGIILSAVAAITATGIDLSSLAIVFGALSVGIGFGLQNIVSNFVAGIIMLIERPVATGDWIEVGGKQGIVKTISVRSTQIETFDRNVVIVPNADFISNAVTNWTRGSLTGRVMVSVTAAHGTDSRRIEAVLQDLAEAHPLVMLNPPPNVALARLGADGMEFEVRVLIRDVNLGLTVRSDLRHEILRRFAEADIPLAPQPQLAAPRS